MFLQLSDDSVGEHQPEAFLGKVKELFPKKQKVVLTGFVGASFDALIEFGVGPGGSCHHSGGTNLLESVQKVVGGVGSSMGLCLQVTAATKFAEQAGPANGMQMGNTLLYQLT